MPLDLSPLSGEDTQSWIVEHHKHHDGEWGDCVAGFCGVIVRVVQAWKLEADRAWDAEAAAKSELHPFRRGGGVDA